jgi:predicted dehydrogenase
MKTAAALGGLPETIPILLRGGDFQVTFDGLWRHFIDCISHSQPSQCTLEDGRSSLRVALAAIESARSGLPVQIQAHDS